MSEIVRKMQKYDVIIGDTVLHMSAYQLTGSCMLREQGTAGGSAAVTASWPKGTRIVLKGTLIGTDYVRTALDALLRAGTTQTVQIGHVVYSNARLIGYRISEGTELPEIMVIFYTNTAAALEATV